MTQDPTVFLVDDDDAVRESLTMYLEHKGQVVESYPTADAFLDTYHPDRPGCLVLDVRMPGMSGPELQETLTAKGYSIPIIFITGHGDIPLSVRAVKAGAVDFLEKPFKKLVLLERIEEAVAHDARTREQAAWEREVKGCYERLTPRERQVMELVVAGNSNKEAAKKLSSSPRTIDVHRAKVMSKMKVATLSELVAVAIACGIHQPGG